MITLIFQFFSRASRQAAFSAAFRSGEGRGLDGSRAGTATRLPDTPGKAGSRPEPNHGEEAEPNPSGLQ
eukprot:15473001-Alexandrium_andersonii.AAC.1